jgi:ankyrin repeat protein
MKRRMLLVVARLLVLIGVVGIVLSGCGTLRKAAQEGNLAEVKSRIEKGENVNDDRFFGGETPLLIAANAGHYDVVEYLISKGANVNTQADGFVLEYSSKISDNNYTYKISRRPRAGNTPLTAAMVGLGQWDRIIALLLEKGANPNGKRITFPAGPIFWHQGEPLGIGEVRSSTMPPNKELVNTPLTRATYGYTFYYKRNDHAKAMKFRTVIELLLKYHADKGEKNDDGDTAYDIASKNGSQELLAMLKPD